MTGTVPAEAPPTEQLADPVRLIVDLLFEPERPGITLPGGGRFELSDFLAIPHPGPQRGVEPVFVRIRGRELEVPYDPVSEATEAEGMRVRPFGAPATPLDEFLDAAYIFGGWKRVECIRWQLQMLPLAVQSPTFCAQELTRRPPGRDIVVEMAGAERSWSFLPFLFPRAQDLLPRIPGAPPEPWANRLAEYLAQGVRTPTRLVPGASADGSGLDRAVRLSRVIDGKVETFTYRLLTALRLVESTAKKLALAKLASLRQLTLSEGWRLLGKIQDATFEEWWDRRYEAAIDETAETAQLQKIVRQGVSPQAQAVLDAHFALVMEILTGAARAAGPANSKGMALPGPAANVVAAVIWMSEVYLHLQSAKVVELRRRHAEAQGALARALMPVANRYPVMLRFTPSELADVAVVEGKQFAVSIYLRLTWALKAANAMKAILDKPQPLESGGPWSARGAPEDQWAKDYKDSVWAYGKVINAAVDALYLTPEMLATAACRNMMAAVQRAREADEAVAAVYGWLSAGLPLAIGIACPPAGVALDAAFSLADAVMQYDVYQTRSAEYYCALDPADSFGEIEPAMLPLVLALAGVALAPL